MQIVWVFVCVFRPTSDGAGQKESSSIFNFNFDIDSAQWPATEDTGSRVMNVTGDSLW